MSLSPFTLHLYIITCSHVLQEKLSLKIKKPPPLRTTALFDLLIYDFLLFVHDRLDLPDRQIELLGKWLVANPIQKPALQYPAISLIENPLVDEMLHLRS